jgi:hypothetical protein
MRLYRGLAEPYKPEKVAEHRKKTGDSPNFTDCPYAALAYAKSGRGVLLVLDVPDDAAERIVREQLWLRSDAKRLQIWGSFDAFIVAKLSAKELRAEMKRCGMTKYSVSDGQRAATLRHLVQAKLEAMARQVRLEALALRPRIAPPA